MTEGPGSRVVQRVARARPFSVPIQHAECDKGLAVLHDWPVGRRLTAVNVKQVTRSPVSFDTRTQAPDTGHKQKTGQLAATRQVHSMDYDGAARFSSNISVQK